MYFVNPSILFALFAVSIPILIHLLNLRKIRKVEFSTLMFLKEIQKSKMRRIKLKQILLLIMRICIIALLVLSFSKPVYEGYAGSHDAADKTTSLIFLDNSFSMNARDNFGQYLNQAKEHVKKILESHKESDEVYLIPSSKISMRDYKFLYNNFQEIFDSLNNLKFSYKGFTIEEVLNFSNNVLKESKNAEKNIFIISDFQKNNFNTQFAPDEFTHLKEKSVNTYLINIGNRDVNNLSLDSFTVVSKILEKNRNIKVRIYLNNKSKFSVKNKIINLYVDGALKGEKTLDVESLDKKMIEFSFKTERTGNISGYIELTANEFQDDEIIDDNKYYFSVNIPEKFNIAFIGANTSDYDFINLAFKTAINMLSDSLNMKSNIFNISYLRDVNESIYGNNAVFVSNKKSFSDKEADVLRDYVSKGGGLFLFLGKDIDVNNYNNTILNKLNTIQINKLNITGENSNLQFDKVDFEHPLLSEIFQNQSLNVTSDKFQIESPKINSYYQILLNRNSAPIITLSNADVFLAESKFADGKVVISSVSATNDLSDFPLKSLFVPMIIRSVYYLGNNFEYKKNYTVGQTNLVSIIGLNNISYLISPNKAKSDWKTYFTSSEENIISLPYTHVTSETGNYLIQDSLGNSFTVPLNYKTEESDLSKLSEEEVLKFFEEIEMKNLKYIQADEEISAVILEKRNGLGLWKYLLIFAIIFLLAELLYSKKLEES